MCETAIDYSGVQPAGEPAIPDIEDVALKTALLAHTGKWRLAYRANAPSPAADPRDPASQRALIALNPQTPKRPLTAADVADEPGAAPLRATPKDVEQATPKDVEQAPSCRAMLGGFRCREPCVA